MRSKFAQQGSSQNGDAAASPAKSDRSFTASPPDIQARCSPKATELWHLKDAHQFWHYASDAISVYSGLKECSEPVPAVSDVLQHVCFAIAAAHCA